MNNDSEERPLPPTPKKLREARRKGQVATSRDLPSTVAFIAAGLTVASLLPKAIADLQGLIDVAGRRAAEAEVQPSALLLPMLWIVLGLSLAPLVAAILGSLAGNLLVLRGLIFALEPIKPKLEKINPVEGFKRLFSLRSLVQLGKVLLQTAILLGAFVVTLAGFTSSLLHLPGCGDPCVSPLLGAIIAALFAIAVVVFLLFGLADIGVQRWLFLRDMRMSRTELKRERKDQEGDPNLKGARRRRMREAAERPFRPAPRLATLVVTAGSDLAVGLRYVPGKTPVPLIVFIAEGEARDAALAAAQDAALIDMPEVAQALAERGSAGQEVPPTLFGPVAQALVRAGAI